MRVIGPLRIDDSHSRGELRIGSMVIAHNTIHPQLVGMSNFFVGFDATIQSDQNGGSRLHGGLYARHPQSITFRTAVRYIGHHGKSRTPQKSAHHCDRGGPIHIVIPKNGDLFLPLESHFQSIHRFVHIDQLPGKEKIQGRALKETTNLFYAGKASLPKHRSQPAIVP